MCQAIWPKNFWDFSSFQCPSGHRNTGIKDTCYCAWLYRVSEKLNSGHYTYIASCLPLSHLTRSSMLLTQQPIEHRCGREYSLWDFSVQAIVRKSKHFAYFHNTTDPSFWCPRSVHILKLFLFSLTLLLYPRSRKSKLCAIEKTFAAYFCFPLLYNFTWGESSKHIFISERTLMIEQTNDPTPPILAN